MSDRVRELERRLSLPLGDEAVATAAITHKSYVNEHRAEGLGDNERLEFLGDAVIDLAVSHRLMERFPRAQEGELSKLRASIVNEAGLSRLAGELGLGELLLLGRGEELTGGRSKPSLLADALEAVIAALYLDGGMERVLAFVDHFLGPALDMAGTASADRDFKTQVQELSQARFRATPRYRVVEERGPDHSKVFVVEMSVAGNVLGRGEGRSKKDAEQLSARAALDSMLAPPPRPSRRPLRPKPRLLRGGTGPAPPPAGRQPRAPGHVPRSAVSRRGDAGPRRGDAGPRGWGMSAARPNPAPSRSGS